MKPLILKNRKLFRELQDFFFTIEFQQRGNKHEHATALNNAPIYGENYNTKIVKFVDKYISTYS